MVPGFQNKFKQSAKFRQKKNSNDNAVMNKQILEIV